MFEFLILFFLLLYSLISTYFWTIIKVLIGMYILGAFLVFIFNER